MHLHLAIAVSSRIRAPPSFILGLCRASIEDVTEACLYTLIRFGSSTNGKCYVVWDRDVAGLRDRIRDLDGNVEMKDNGGGLYLAQKVDDMNNQFSWGLIIRVENGCSA
jgi:hypothetical protein